MISLSKNLLSTVIHYLVNKVPLGLQTVDEKGNAVKEYLTDPDTNLIKIPVIEKTADNDQKIVVGTTLFSGTNPEGSKSNPTKVDLNQVNADFSNLPNGIQIFFGGHCVIKSTDSNLNQIQFPTTLFQITPDISQPINIPKQKLVKNSKLATLTSKKTIGSRLPMSTQSFSFNFTFLSVNELNIELNDNNQLLYYVGNNDKELAMIKVSGSFTFHNVTNSIVAFFQIPIVKIVAY